MNSKDLLLVLFSIFGTGFIVIHMLSEKIPFILVFLMFFCLIGMYLIDNSNFIKRIKK